MAGRPSGASADTRLRLLDAAQDLMRSKGYAATTVDDVCKAAGLTKGSFFHHFASKEELGVAVADRFGSQAVQHFSSSPYRQLADPRERVLAHVDLRTAMLQGPISQFSCILGTFVQELYETNSLIREACEKQMAEHNAAVAADLEEAKSRYVPDATWTPAGVASYVQAVTQGALILAKAEQGPAVAIECFGHLRHYLESLFDEPVATLGKGRAAIEGYDDDTRTRNQPAGRMT
jgi:TetR/AcrR family transcriptional regulator, transcriptional repressor for nem operon